MSWPKVLVFTPTYEGKDYCLTKFIENCKKFTYSHYDHIFLDNSNDGGAYYSKLCRRLNPLGIKVFRIQRGNTSREALARAQNKAREIFLEGNYDYLMSLESDIFPASNIIEALIWANRDVVTGLYLIGEKEKGTRTPCITVPWKNEKTNTMGSRLLTPEEYPQYIKQGLKRVMAGGMGVCLMSRYVVKDIAFTYIPGHEAHSDVFFFNDAIRKGYEVWCDTNLVCAHLNSSWDLVLDR